MSIGIDFLSVVSIYSTRNDKFVVIEGGTNLYATLIQSNHNQKWTINENAVDALSFIKSKTNVSLSDNYKSLVEAHLEQVSIEEKAQMEADLKAQEIQGYKDRIAALTEKFKNDPTKLAVLSKLAQEVNKVNVDYIESGDKIEIIQKKAKYLENDTEKDANILYKETRIKKDEFLKIFGENGNITIKNSNDIVIANINKDTEANEEGKIVITYPEEEKEIKLETSEPQNIGSLNIENTKTIKVWALWLLKIINTII